jgi:hypothetical protein
LRGYEKYVTSGRNLEAALNILPKNSEDYLFLQLIHTLNESGQEALQSDKGLKESFTYLKDRYNSDRANMIKLREILLRYDTAKSEEDKLAALNELKDHCWWNHEYTKPSNLKKIKKNEEVKGGAGAGEDTSEEEDEELRRYSSAFKSEEEFNRAVLVDNYLSNNNASVIHPVCFTYSDIFRGTSLLWTTPR